MINREILKNIRDHLTAPEISLICGARQVGKTTLMENLKEELENQGKNVLFLSHDFERDKPCFESQDAMTARIRLEFGPKEGFVFLDEIQRRENAGLFLKGLYDMRLPVKFIVSGSGSIELKEKISESLAGRKRMFEVTPVTFNEFLDHRTGYRYSGKLASFYRLNGTKSLSLLNEYINFGGYPRVIKADTLREKILIINDIYQSYLDRDISSLIGAGQHANYARLIRLLAARTGQMVNLSSIGREVQLSLPAVQKYLWIAEKTFFIKLIPPFSGNAGKEITKAPVVYFNDHGMRNFAISAFGNIQRPQDYGFVFQNLTGNIILQELSGSPFTLHFWRTTDHAEVDFVIRRRSDPLPVEIKFSAMNRPVVTRSLRNFLSRYNSSEAWVVNLELEDTMQIGGSTVRFIPVIALQDKVRELVSSIESAYVAEEKAFPYRILRR